MWLCKPHTVTSLSVFHSGYTDYVWQRQPMIKRKTTFKGEGGEDDDNTCRHCQVLFSFFLVFIEHLISFLSSFFLCVNISVPAVQKPPLPSQFPQLPRHSNIDKFNNNACWFYIKYVLFLFFLVFINQLIFFFLILSLGIYFVSTCAVLAPPRPTAAMSQQPPTTLSHYSPGFLNSIYWGGQERMTESEKEGLSTWWGPKWWYMMLFGPQVIFLLLLFLLLTNNKFSFVTVALPHPLGPLHLPCYVRDDTCK